MFSGGTIVRTLESIFQTFADTRMRRIIRKLYDHYLILYPYSALPSTFPLKEGGAFFLIWLTLFM